MESSAQLIPPKPHRASRKRGGAYHVLVGITWAGGAYHMLGGIAWMMCWVGSLGRGGLPHVWDHLLGLGQGAYHVLGEIIWAGCLSCVGWEHLGGLGRRRLPCLGWGHYVGSPKNTFSSLQMAAAKTLTIPTQNHFTSIQERVPWKP